MNQMLASMHGWSWVDWLILAIMLISAGVSITRGFTRETLSLVVWTLATLNAYLLGDAMGALLGSWVSQPTLRVTIGMACLFVLTLVVGALLSHVLAEMIKKSGLTSADRILGLFFGVARAVIIVMALTIYMPGIVKQTQGWQRSAFAPQFSKWESWSRQTVQGIGNTVHRKFT